MADMEMPEWFRSLPLDVRENLPEILAAISVLRRGNRLCQKQSMTFGMGPTERDSNDLINNADRLLDQLLPEDFEMVVSGICRGCGCTHDNACETDDGPCAWADEAQTLCTACSPVTEAAGG